MNILFLVDVDENNKSGLFMATHNRIKKTKVTSTIGLTDVYNIHFFDNKVIIIIKKILGKKIIAKSKDFFIHDGVKYHNINLKNSLISKIMSKIGIDYYLYRKLLSVININKFDIISAHWGSPPGSAAYHISNLCNIPYVLTLHGSDIHTIPFEDKLFRKFVIRNMNKASNVFFVSDKLRSEAKKVGWDDKKSKSLISLNAVDDSIFFPSPISTITKLKKKHKMNNVVVGYVGNLVEIKRADYLVEIFKEIQNKYIEKITFLIIGDGPLKAKIEHDANLACLDIRLLGYIDHQNMSDYLSSMNCLVLPSKNEGTPNIILEAQSCGTPVVATNVGGISEIINDQKNLVDNDEDNITNIFALNVLKVLNSNCYTKSNSASWDDIVQREVIIFEKIIKNS